MKSMNLFSDAGDKSSEELFGDNKSKTNIKLKKLQINYHLHQFRMRMEF